MMSKILFLLIALFVQLNFFAQDVVGVHRVEKTTQEKEYLIQTSISGLKNVDIAKLVIELDSIHQFKKAANNSYFFDRKGNEIKFYLMSVPPSGEVIIEFSIELSKQGDFTFPVKFQYSKNEEKKQLDLPGIKVSNLPLLAVETQNISQSKDKEETDKQADIEKEKQLEEEKLAKNIARFNAEQEEKKKQEEAKELALQKAQEEKELQKKLDDEVLAKTEVKKQSEIEKEKQLEEEKLAKNIARFNAEQEEKKKQEEVKRKELAQEALEEKKMQQKFDADILAKTEDEKQAKLLAEQKKSQEMKVVVEDTKSNLKTYSVQLLSLSSFSEERLNNYCKKHNLSKDKIVKRQVGNLMKISYGKVNSQSEATILQQTLKNNHQIEASFIVVLN